ncbi:hypothetical protein CH298_02695 [Rhodococcoides fascians]|uniref:VG15 protein n=1 Tax=Rhodococcoides fascians TaxID=1828 RepID=UPI000B9BD439|nr:hypothetical protein [Rhodococcus fascians]OZE92461.1 hypothetical protein CH303_02695 [Rhodococcus fascians]OZF23094.1 hypothetical protein CH298_02695 [Rhodococcus fascians]OZF24808.1 hypothetical protein CH297_02695 [Rhodococcus fascians]OZF72403.1 hypothetical protein CH308_02700 [Rhodococcus fascians]OZF73701.1 hypothetical protein CH307_02695 [Rhodococcus fascians]
MTLLDDSRALQLGLGELSTLTVNDLALVWRSLYDAGGDPIELRDALVQAVPEILIPYETAAGELTASWYEDLAPRSRFIAKPAEVSAVDAVAASTRWALSPLFTPGNDTSPLSLLSGMAKRRVFNASRQTVLDNASREGNVQYARYASKTACEFCRLLATRGAVYGSKEAATRVAGRGKEVASNFRPDGRKKRGGQAKGVRIRGNQKSGDRFHDNCKCIAVAVRPGTNYEPPSYVQQWDEQYIEASRGGGGTKAILARMRAAEQ